MWPKTGRKFPSAPPAGRKLISHSASTERLQKENISEGGQLLFKSSTVSARGLISRLPHSWGIVSRVAHSRPERSFIAHFFQPLFRPNSPLALTYSYPPKYNEKRLPLNHPQEGEHFKNVLL